MYTYLVLNVAKVIDGDTFDFDCDLGFHARLRVRVRLEGIDTWEMWGTNAHPQGVPARDFAAQWLTDRADRHALAVTTFKLRPGTPVADGSFGRWLGRVFDQKTDERLADALRDAGFAKTEV